MNAYGHKRRTLLALLGATFGSHACGCALWDVPKSSQPSKPPQNALAQDSVILEAAFAHMPTDEPEVEEAIWKQVDELVLEASVRRRLESNGFRIGILGAQMPTALRDLIEQEANVNPLDVEGDDVSGSEDSRPYDQRRIQCRAGKRVKIQTAPIVPEFPLLEFDSSGKLLGENLRDAQCQIEIKAFPQGDGSTKVELTPEIEHGDYKNRITTAESSLVMQAGKLRKTFDDLRCHIRVAPGQSIILGAIRSDRGMAQRFFRETRGGGTPQRTVTVIRLAQTQMDDLFAPYRAPEPLATSTE